jgi:hypothetical protein
MLGVLARFCPIIVQVTPLKTPFGLVTPITRSGSHTQLLITPLHNYNPCAFVPTITYCTVTLLTIDPLCCRSSILRLDSFFSCQLLTALFAGWLTDSLSSPAGSLTLRNSCLKVGMCGRYSQHLVPRFVSAL